jgi:hypothetical protein
VYTISFNDFCQRQVSKKEGARLYRIMFSHVPQEAEKKKKSMSPDGKR